MKNSLILAATPNLEKSLDFYRKLDFTIFENHGRYFAVDGSYVIEIRIIIEYIN